MTMLLNHTSNAIFYANHFPDRTKCGKCGRTINEHPSEVVNGKTVYMKWGSNCPIKDEDKIRIYGDMCPNKCGYLVRIQKPCFVPPTEEVLDRIMDIGEDIPVFTLITEVCPVCGFYVGKEISQNQLKREYKTFPNAKGHVMSVSKKVM